MDKNQLPANEPANQQASDKAKIYTLAELLEKMAPQHRIDQALMRECIDGLGVYAALIAQEDPNSSKPAEIRDFISSLVPYWGLDQGENGKPPEDFIWDFGAQVAAAVSGEKITEDTLEVFQSVSEGLYLHGHELAVAQGSDAMGEILKAADMLVEVSRQFGFETTEVHSMAARLEAIVGDMLKDLSLPGQPVNNVSVKDYAVKQAILFDNDRGFALAHNPDAVSPYVTWQLTNEDGKLDYYWGHYFETEEKALVDYIDRVAHYKAAIGVKEKSLPGLPSHELSEPKQLSSVLKAIKKGKESPKPPRQAKADKKKSKSDEVL